jgi:hypothetical protein
MFNKYADLILLIIVLIEVVRIYLTIKAHKKNSELLTKEKREKDKLIEIILELNPNKTTAATANSRNLQLMILNTERINTLEQQMTLINYWLAELNISNLIPAKDRDPNIDNIIEEMRQRVDWVKKRQQNINEKDFYQGG